MGDKNLRGPFLFTRSEAQDDRYQEVHGRTDFLAAAAPTLLITEISYSAPTWSGRVPIDVTLQNIEIRLSTTGRNPDALSINFSDNIGPDERVVFSAKGKNIVGASGRIDLSGDMGEGTIIREDHGWAIVAARVPKRKVIPLNEESLLEALKTVMRQ